MSKYKWAGCGDRKPPWEWCYRCHKWNKYGCRFFARSLPDSTDREKEYSGDVTAMPVKPVGRKPRKGINEFIQGFACAIGTLAREHGHPGMAADIMHCNGITFEQLKAAGVDEFDLKPLREEFGVKGR